MTIRRPDAHTLQQREASRRAKAAAFCSALAGLTEVNEAVRRAQIREVYWSEVRRGTNCHVVRP